MLFTVAPPVCVAKSSTTKTITHDVTWPGLPFTENSRSTYVSFENIVGQRVVPSPAKNMPPKTKPNKKVGNHPKIDPAPRDRAANGTVSYPQLTEGGLNKYSKSQKDKRTAEAVDNLDLALKLRFLSDSNETIEVMGLKIEAEKLIWILINEDDEKRLATIISAMIASLKQAETTIHPLCKGVLENKNDMLKNHTDKINKLYDTLLASFVD